MAHMDRMVMLHVWGMREEPNSKRVREKISNKAPREPMDAVNRSPLFEKEAPTDVLAKSMSSG